MGAHQHVMTTSQSELRSVLASNDHKVQMEQPKLSIKIPSLLSHI